MKAIYRWKKEITFQVGKEWHIQTSVSEHCFIGKNGCADNAFRDMGTIWID